MTPLDQARGEAVALLCQVQAEGLISVRVFEVRYEMVQQAETVATIRAIVADFHTDALAPTPTPTPPAPPETGTLAPVGYETRFPIESYDPPLPAPAAPSIRLPSILGSTTRGGPWTVPEHLELLVILGELHLDFRDATFVTDTVEIDMSVTLGTLKVTVPPGTQVEYECREVLASSKFPKKGRNAAPPNGYLVVLRGTLFLGELVIKEASPSGTKQTIRQRLGLAPP